MKFTHPAYKQPPWPHCITVYYDGVCFSIVNGEAFADSEHKALILKSFGFKLQRETRDTKKETEDA